MESNILKMTEKGAKINSDFKGLREVRLFRNNRWKRVFIVHGENEYLYDGKTKYFNFSLLTKEILSQNNEIYLSFRN